MRETSALPFERATSGYLWLRNSSAGKASSNKSTRWRSARNTSNAALAKCASSPACSSARRMASWRSALMSCTLPGRDRAAWARKASRASGWAHSACVAGACRRSQSCKAVSARAMVGHTGQSVSSRSRLTTRIRERSRGTGEGQKRTRFSKGSRTRIPQPCAALNGGWRAVHLDTAQGLQQEPGAAPESGACPSTIPSRDCAPFSRAPLPRRLPARPAGCVGTAVDGATQPPASGAAGQRLAAMGRGLQHAKPGHHAASPAERERGVRPPAQAPPQAA